MHDGMQYDLIQGLGHEPLKVGDRPFSKAISSPTYLLENDHGILN